MLSFLVPVWKFHAINSLSATPKGSQDDVGEFPFLPLAPMPFWAGLSRCKRSSPLQNFSTGVFWTRLGGEGLAVAGGD